MTDNSMVLGLWCIAPLLTSGGGIQSTRRKQPTCRNSLTNIIT